MPTRIAVRRDTAANWGLANPVLVAGEPALNTDDGSVRYGNGVDHWVDLPEHSGDAALATAAQGAKADTALQPSDVGTAAAHAATDFATAAQGAKADSATQPAALATALVPYIKTVDANGTFVTFVQHDGSPVPAGHHVEVTLTADGTDIDDIKVVAG